MDVRLDKSLEGYVADRIESGEFESAADVVNDAVRTQQEEYFRRLEGLRREVQKGLDDIAAGRISRAGPEEIIAKARARMGLK